MATVAIVYHSGYGHTKAIAESVHQGAASVAGVTATPGCRAHTVPTHPVRHAQPL